jgi:hypothetical protein
MKTQHDLFTSLSAVFSADRLSTYRLPADTDGVVLARYLWNTLLGEALYPLLQALEVALRNSMHTAITRAYGRDDWYDRTPTILRPIEQQKVTEVKRSLLAQAPRKGVPGVAMLTPGRIVAELTFGFWTGLFSAAYESHVPTNPLLWPRLVTPIFPYAPRSLRTRRKLAGRLNDLRHLRNRVFHHEPLWNNRQLLQRHQELLDVLHWINPDLFDTMIVFDRFPTLYAAGPTQCSIALAQIMI